MKLFLDDWPRLLADARAALARGDAAGLRQAAHALKGMVDNFKAPAAFEAALRLEALARAEDLAGAVAACAVLEDELKRLGPALAVYGLPAPPRETADDR